MSNLINTPHDFSFTNEISLNNDRTQCNPFNENNNMGNYFQQCQKESNLHYGDHLNQFEKIVWILK